jgi:hypothetical protein
VTVLSPMCRIRPCCCSSASASTCGADRTRLGGVEAADAQVHHVHRVQAEPAQVAVDLLAQLLGAARGRPAALLVAAGADLGDDDQVVGVGRECLADDLVGDVRAVVVGGVDVGDAQLDDLAQHGHGGVAVLRRAEHTGAGELHGAVAEAGQLEVADAVGAAGELRGRHGLTFPAPAGPGACVHCAPVARAQGRSDRPGAARTRLPRSGAPRTRCGERIDGPGQPSATSSR